MKKKCFSIFLLSLFMFLFTLFAPTNNVAYATSTHAANYDLCIKTLPATSKIKLNKKKLTLYTNKTYNGLKVSPKAKNRNVKKLTWKSSNTKIASVNSKGVIKTKNAGKCIISVKAKGGKWVKCKLTVKKFKVTRGMKNALKQAKSYLRTSLAFSKKSLTEQLKYHKYTNKQVSYAIDNCNANWKKQAVKCAKNYLDSEYLAFSYDELWGQLEYEGFTESQIEYAMNKVW